MMESVMKYPAIFNPCFAALLLTATACDAPDPDAVPIAVSTAEVAAKEAVEAEIERINQLEDPDELYAILEKETTYRDVGKAADAQLAKVLEDDFATADNPNKLFDLKRFTGVPRAKVNRMYADQKDKLEGRKPG